MNFDPNEGAPPDFVVNSDKKFCIKVNLSKDGIKGSIKDLTFNLSTDLPTQSFSRWWCRWRIKGNVHETFALQVDQVLNLFPQNLEVRYPQNKIDSW